ncbi:unnamed protein product [Calypogeia fissa]
MCLRKEERDRGSELNDYNDSAQRSPERATEVLNQGYSAWSGCVRGFRLTLVNQSYRLIQNFSLKVRWLL